MRGNHVSVHQLGVGKAFLNVMESEPRDYLGVGVWGTCHETRVLIAVERFQFALLNVNEDPKLEPEMTRSVDAWVAKHRESGATVYCITKDGIDLWPAPADAPRTGEMKDG